MKVKIFLEECVCLPLGKLVALALLFGCIARNGSPLEAANGSSIEPRDTWEKYASAKNMDEASTYVVERDFPNFYNALPPGSEYIRRFHVESYDVYGPNLDSGRVNLKFLYEGKFYDNWFALRKEQGQWQLTFDERVVLRELTKAWRVKRIGNFRFHFRQEFLDKWRLEAVSAQRKFDELKEVFGKSPDLIEHYIATNGEEAKTIDLWPGEGNGTARYRMIKGYNIAFHGHELVHVFASEVGSAGPLIDEGLATALADEDLIKSSADCLDVLSLLEEHDLSNLFDGSKFRLLSQAGRNVYGLSQRLLVYYLEKFGMPKILEFLELANKSPDKVITIVHEVLESTVTSSEHLQSALAAKCR